MGGGLMQLVAYGAQDIYLTGNPQITFFKVVYRRHTNFSMESILQTWNGGETSNDSRITSTISRNGDLLSRLYVTFEATPAGTSCDNPGALCIKEVEVEIGGQSIDKHSGNWMEVWTELTEPNPSHMLGDANVAVTGTFSGTRIQNMARMGGVNWGGGSQAFRATVPLQFWFCRNPGLALPLIALQYHEVKIIMTTASLSVCTYTKNELWADYIYLDTDERRRFAQVSHEYLIEQVQSQKITGTTLPLNFNHPVKELIWTKAGSGVTECLPASIGTRGTSTWKLKLNGHDRFAARDVDYFCVVQVWQHHTGAPVDTLGSSGGNSGTKSDTIGVYSFALKPEEHQPSGTCNFSRIDNAELITTAGSATYNVYAVNYNVLRIMSGMGGLAYSN